MADTTIEEARAAKQQIERRLADVGGVVGIGLTKVGAAWAVKVNFERAPDDRARLPERIDGVPVVVEVTGPIKARRD